MGSVDTKDSRGGAVGDVDGSGQGFTPEGEWHLGSEEETSCHLHKSPVLPLCHSILFRSVGNSRLMLNPLGGEILLESLGDVLPPIVGT